MKKLLIYSVLAISLAMPVAAQTGTTTNTQDTTKQSVREQIQNRAEALKEQLQKIKDERKQQIVEKIDSALDALNKRYLNHLSNVLDRLEDVLKRIGSRADKAQTRTLDVTSVRTAIDKATQAIAAARAAIQTQSGKTYTITITSEDNVRTDVGKTRKALHDDLVKVRDAVKAAREAIRQAATTLAQIPKVDEDNTSPTQEDNNN